METIYRIILCLAGMINFLPTLIAFLPQKISSFYGVEIPDANYELLLRHRAVLFGIVGGLMIYAAISNKHIALVTTVGFISMLSFIGLYFMIDGAINPALTKVMKIDVVASVVLLLGYLFYRFYK
ncbi:MAG: phosphopantetheine adenylyltransferase [Bacteroidota bacterium]